MFKNIAFEKEILDLKNLTTNIRIPFDTHTDVRNQTTGIGEMVKFE